MSESIRQQAIGRVLRFGQESIVLVYEYFTDKLQYPAGHMFDIKVANNEDIEMGHWMIREGSLYKLQEDEPVLETDNDDPDDVITRMMELIRGR
ncbi:hypothetical protein VTN96DRAFT_7020 [Rasamsonia emersonii]